MEIRIVKRSELDYGKWTELVTRSAVSVYNQVHYLDSLAEHWAAIIVGDYQGGMAIPYTIRLGVKGIYTPIFLRAVDWMGIKPDDMEAVEKNIFASFTRAQLNMNQPVFSGSNELIYQHLVSAEEFKLGSQSKRSIKKFEKSALAITPIEVEEALPLIVRELKEKVKGLRSIDFLRFSNLLLNYDRSKIKCYGIRGEELHAAAVIILHNNEWLFIKGGVDTVGKQNGSMHALTNFLIKSAFEGEQKFSFEGSNVESVRQFNLGFGAVDKVYYSWNWNRSPWWFRILMLLRK